LQTCFIIEEAVLLDSCALCCGNCFATFRRNIPSSSSGLWICKLTHNAGETVGTFLRNFRNKLPNNAV